MPPKKGKTRQSPKAVDEYLQIDINTLSEEDRRLYDMYLRRLKRDTTDRLTETEYNHLARMELYLYYFDKHASAGGIANMEPQQLDVSRRYREKIMDTLRRSREQGDKPDTMLADLKEFLLNDDAKNFNKKEWKDNDKK